MMSNPENKLEIHRHKAAMRRSQLSSTIRAALRHEIITQEQTHLDYGCGRGNDVEFLQEIGFNSIGYDPYYFPKPPEPADIVTLNCVLNVIECPVERSRTLTHAYALAKKTLIVSSIIGEKKLLNEGTRYRDGIITK
jgi:DNA phosphorothioation-associated putative methyltransferase